MGFSIQGDHRMKIKENFDKYIELYFKYYQIVYAQTRYRPKEWDT